MKHQIPKNPQLPNFFTKSFLKSTLTQKQVSAILQNTQLLTPSINTEIFHQGDQIHQYFFIIKGIIQLHKTANRIDNNYKETIILESGQIAGQYFNTLHNIREYTAQVKLQQTQIIKIQKKYFDSLFQQLITQYTQIDRYAHQALHLSKKINSFDIFTAKLYRLGSHINLNSNQIGVILNGQCKILYKTHHIPRKCSLPQIKPKYKSRIKQIALISENQWIFTENLQEQETITPLKFIYLVTSQTLKLLIMPTNKINILPRNKIEILNQLFNDRKNMIINPSQHQSTKQNKKYYQIKSNQQKYTIDSIKKIFQNIDPYNNLNFVLKQYQSIQKKIKSHYQSNQQQSSLNYSLSHKTKQQLLQKSSSKYYQNKIWSHNLLKLSHVH